MHALVSEAQTVMADQGDAGGKVEKMKEIPVLFNGAMVRAIINDRKTQTRRPLPAVFNSPPSLVHGWLPPGWRLFGQEVPDHWGAQWYGTYPSMVRSPLGKPGDRLWVRETWAMLRGATELVTFEGQIPERQPKSDSLILGMVPVPFYRADGERSDVASGNGLGKAWKWRPSIDMPRWAARLFLDVLDVRIERLQDITEEDAWQEGIEAVDGALDEALIARMAKASGYAVDDARATFAALWARIYGAESWAANPWVWVTEFKRVT